jgi:hypothetical protein
MAWGCAMESCFRVFSLVSFVNRFENITLQQRNIIKKIVELEHDFILNNLEEHSFNNHIFFNIMGLILSENFISPGNVNDLWYERLSFLCREQFNADGTNFEASTGYHLLMLEALAFCTSIDPRSRTTIINSMNVSGAILFLNCIFSEAYMFLVGDNDSSRLFGGAKGCSRSKQRDFVLQQFGSELGKNYKATEVVASNYFPDFGAVFFSDKQFNMSLWNVKAGQRGKAGHNHNDELSICLTVNNKPLIIDPGVFSYSILRNYHRSVEMHSSPSFLDFEFEDMRGNFEMSSRSLKTMTKISDSEYELEVSYDRYYIKRYCKKIESGLFSFSDKFGDKSDNLIPVIKFILGRDVTVDIVERNIYLGLDSNVKAAVLNFNSTKFETKISSVYISDEYGEVSQSKMITIFPKERIFNWSLQIE